MGFLGKPKNVEKWRFSAPTGSRERGVFQLVKIALFHEVLPIPGFFRAYGGTTNKEKKNRNLQLPILYSHCLLYY